MSEASPGKDRALSRRRRADRAAQVLATAATVVTVAVLASVVLNVVRSGVEGSSLSLLTSLPRPVGVPGGGVANAVLGTVLLVMLACAMALPVGLLAGVHLAESRSGRIVRIARLAADALAAVPSIVFGMFVFGTVVVKMRHFSALAGSASLALVMVPSLARATEVALRAVPENVREAALALGATRLRVALTVVLPSASRGIGTGVLLAIARACGETAPLLFTAWNNRFFCDDLRDPSASLPVQIFTYAVSPYEDWHQKAWASALVLLAFVLVLHTAARILSPRREEGA